MSDDNKQTAGGDGTREDVPAAPRRTKPRRPALRPDEAETAEENGISKLEKLTRRRRAAEDMLTAGGRGGDISGQDLHKLRAPYAQRTDLNARKADLSNSNLTGANIGDRLDARDASFRNSFLDFADLSHGDLRHADLAGARAWDVELRGARLAHADLRKADLRGSNLIGADLRGADLTGADLRGVDLTGAILDGAKLDGTRIDGAIFDKASLQNARFTHIVARKTLFRDADLRGATFSCSNFDTCNFEDSELAGANARLCGFISCRFDGAVLRSDGLGFGCIASTWHACTYEDVDAKEISDHPAMLLDKRLNTVARLGARALAGGVVAGAAAAISWIGLPSLHEAFVHDQALRSAAAGVIGAVAIPLAAMAADAAAEAGRDALREGGFALYGRLRKALSTYVGGVANTVTSLSRKVAVFVGCGKDRTVLTNAMQAVRPHGGRFERWAAFATELGHVILCDRDHYLAAVGLIQDATCKSCDVATSMGKAVAIVHGTVGSARPDAPDVCVLRPDATVSFVWTENGKASRREVYAKDRSFLHGSCWDAAGTETPIDSTGRDTPNFKNALDRFGYADIGEGPEIAPAARIELLAKDNVVVSVEFDSAGKTSRIVSVDGSNSAGERALTEVRIESARLWLGSDCKMVAAYNSRGKITEMVRHEDGERVSLDRVSPAWVDAAQLRRNLHVGLPEPERENLRERTMRNIGERFGFTAAKHRRTRTDLDPEL